MGWEGVAGGGARLGKQLGQEPSQLGSFPQRSSPPQPLVGDPALFQRFDPGLPFTEGAQDTPPPNPELPKQ